MIALLVAASIAQLTGALNPEVTQDNITTTICHSGWATQQRFKYAPQQVSENIKRKIFRAQKATGHLGDYELNHIVSIELGGALLDLTNLDLQPLRGRDGAKAGDLVENSLHSKVCKGTMTLGAAQVEIVRYDNQHRNHRLHTTP